MRILKEIGERKKENEQEKMGKTDRLETQRVEKWQGGRTNRYGEHEAESSRLMIIQIFSDLSTIFIIIL